MNDTTGPQNDETSEENPVDANVGNVGDDVEQAEHPLDAAETETDGPLDAAETETDGPLDAESEGTSETDIDTLTRQSLFDLTVEHLRDFASDRDINLHGRDVKDDIVDTIWDALVESGEVAYSEEGLADMAGKVVDPAEAVEGVEVTEANALDLLQTVVNTQAEAIEYFGMLNSTISALHIEISKLKGREAIVGAELAQLQKAAGVKPVGCTLHGHVDDLPSDA